MSDILTTLTRLINSPPGQLAAGGVLAGIVWKFFERVEAVLTDQTKLEIAVWLLDRRGLASTFQDWPKTFRKLFDRVFGTKQFSMNCFWRASVASIITAMVSAFLIFCSSADLQIRNEFALHSLVTWSRFVAVIVLSMLLVDYVTLGKTRFCLGIINTTQNGAISGLLLIGDLIAAVVMTTYGCIAVEFLFFASEFSGHLRDQSTITVGNFQVKISYLEILYRWLRIYVRRPDLALQSLWREDVGFGFLPALFSSVWLWLYAGSGFLLKAARRFDLGFDWFNRHFDIEKKPLQSIGLVAGALVAVVYWTAVIVSRVVG